MSYQNVEHALALTIRQIQNLTASNVALGGSNDVLLSQRVSVRLTTGRAVRKHSGMQSVRTDWVVHADAFVKTSDSTSDADKQEVQDLSQALVDVVSVYPTLGSYGLVEPDDYAVSEQIVNVETSIPGEPVLERIGRTELWRHRVDFTVSEEKVVAPDFDAKYDTAKRVRNRRYRIRLPSEVFVGSEKPEDTRQGDLWIEGTPNENQD